MKKIISGCLLLLGLRSHTAFGQQSIDAYVTDSSNNVFVLVAGTANSLSSPIDLDFYPDQSQRPFELWILNQGTSSSGGSTVIVSNANQSSRIPKYVKDGNAWHFMAMASAIAFGDKEWATSADILDANHGSGKYTGPTLWPGDLSIYGIVGNPSSQLVNGSHLDMIHQSPYSKGIAFERNLAFWVLDGYEGTLKRYDFVQPHQPGGADHSAGKVRVYSDFQFTKHSTLPSHIVIDAHRKYLYGCDPVGKRIFRVDITTGTNSGPATEVNTEALAEYSKYSGLTIQDVVTTGLTRPVGIDVYGNRLIVTDNATDEIIIYDITANFSEIGRIKLKYVTNPDPMGIKVGPDGKIYFADKANARAYMIENTNIIPLSAPEVINTTFVSAYPNPTSGRFIVQHKEIPEPTEISVFNAIGEKIMQLTSVSEQTEIDLSAFPSGVYYIRVDGNIFFSQKIIKQ